MLFTGVLAGFQGVVSEMLFLLLALMYKYYWAKHPQLHKWGSCCSTLSSGDHV